MDIAERIKKLREAFGITSNELAKITGIHPVSIRKYETRKMVPGIEVIDKMCAALKLPRTIFEGIPEQYINYDFIGDFYQTVFMLMACGAIDVKGKRVDTESKDVTYLTLNQQLSQYIEIYNKDEIIPFENLSIRFKTEDMEKESALDMFNYYLTSTKQATDTLASEHWDDDSEPMSKEDTAAVMHNIAEEYQLELMLMGHSWKQYMQGMKDLDEQMADLEAYIQAGGDSYGFIMSADMPDSMKERYITAYEDAYIDEIIKPEYILTHGEYPSGKSHDERTKWTMGLVDAHNQYKIDHPDYKEEARKHAAENARIARENYVRDHKED